MLPEARTLVAVQCLRKLEVGAEQGPWKLTSKLVNLDERRILVWILDEVFLKQSCLPNQDIGSRESLGDMCEASGAGHAVFYIKSRGNMREPGLSPSILGATVMLFFHIFPLNMLNHC